MNNFEKVHLATGGVLLKAELHISADHPGFEGHFSEFKLLPAVSQLQLLETLYKHAIGQNNCIEGGSKIKFLRPVLPDDIIHINCSIVKTGTAEFTISKDERIASKGTLYFKRQKSGK